MSKQWLKQPAFIQSFAPTSLVYISNQTDLPKIFLIDDTTMPTQDTNQSYWEITSDSYLDFIKEYVVGIGPWKDTIVPVSRNYLDTPSDLVARAHARNLQVHPYTFRNENKFLHFNFSEDPYNEYDYWINKIGVDGLFTDFTGSLHQYQEWTNPYASGEKEVTRLLHKIELMLSKFKYVTSVKLYLTLSDQGNAIYWSVYIIGFPIYIYQNKNRFQHIVAGARRFLKRLDPLDLSPSLLIYTGNSPFWDFCYL
ncbi:hypothetical protein K7X08_022429 [Anisodus acutangulus]|uniref:glycerophosphodiester phosphodiesterase n=1 Tax=Anisodus acutangulus TaxID=402998 RepID=A0A9Q1MJ09_9SOLA|nr:hypothetical protein K7X08_022429 [Anisodus acutangulus]